MMMMNIEAKFNACLLRRVICNSDHEFDVMYVIKAWIIVEENDVQTTS
jgi:hypothetical protein